jgi:predicted metal-dependent hydrolase
VTETKPVASSLVVDGITLQLHLQRRRVKNVNARLHGRRLDVSAPMGVPDAQLEAIVGQLARRLLRRMRADEVNEEQSAAALAQRVAARFPRPPQVTAVHFVTGQRARWGSYSLKTGAVRLHAALRAMPAWVLEAVVAHELAHALVPDHSRAFWELVRAVCPSTDRARAFLEGVSWLASAWDDLPPVERALLRRPGHSEDSAAPADPPGD